MRWGAVIFAGFAMLAAPLSALDITAARYADPTNIYGHGAVQGGEYAQVQISLSDGSTRAVSFERSVFEDTVPRLYDFDGDGTSEVVTVVSGFETGAAVYVLQLSENDEVIVHRNAPIGRRNRWLAVAGIADFDGDGRSEIAYVDRPHLAKELVLLPVDLGSEGLLTASNTLGGLTNHRYGAPMIEGGVRACPGDVPVILTADADWDNIVETRYENGALRSVAVGSYQGPDSFASYLRCD